MSGIIVLVVLVLTVFFVISIYNGLVRKRNQYKNAYSQIDVQLQRRYDLIPNLVESAKGYMEHEKETLTKVIEARNAAHKISIDVRGAAGNPELMKQLSQAEQGLQGAMKSFMALAERYPDLKANTNVQNLMEELSSTENRIAFSRQAYNDAVTSFNNACETFPNSVVANQFNFKHAELLDMPDPEAAKAVKVSFA